MLQFDMLTPAEQIAMLMRRIYEQGMTTTSGGNLSLIDDDGAVWISPSGVDKGTLSPADVVCVRRDGAVQGLHKPSLEYPFHRAIYDARPDLRAIVHAHPAGLVAFSIVHRIPDTHIIPQAEEICGAVGYAKYALPGGKELGENIARCFGEGSDCVLLENHGVACGGRSLLDAFQRFETLDFCARLHIQARQLGTPRLLSVDQLALLQRDANQIPEFEVTSRSTREKELRRHICDMIHRAYDQHLMTSTEGALSARLDDSSFVITPHGVDRHYLEIGDIVTIRAGRRESGKLPSRAVQLHQRIYQRHAGIGAIMTAQPPHVMAFGVTEAAFDIRAIPESYFVLRDVPRLPFEGRNDHERITGMLSLNCPMIMIENDAMIITGGTIMQAFDRLEVAEFIARSILHASVLGGAVAMSDEQIAEIRARFF